jgi:hypothetical protein
MPATMTSPSRASRFHISLNIGAFLLKLVVLFRI